ncbi:7TM-DISM domain-containing protein, partial [Ideonella sp.]|uniref:7TM-DISM domain-containing protein n=1 Tax=Ideonella sp. TaxID=1929293 RepID=UPI003BB4A9C7
MHLYICRLFAILASLLTTPGLAKGTGLDPAPCRIDAEASIIVLRDCTTESRRDGALLRNFIHLQWEGTRPSQHVLGLGMPHPKVAQVRQSGPDEAPHAVSDSIDASVLLNIGPDTPAAQRPPPGLQLGVPLQLHPGLNRIEVLAQPLGTPIRLPEARLYTDAAWQNWNAERAFQSGALLGVLLMLLAALGLAYALGREPSYPPYAALTLSYVLGILHLSGHLQPAFWQHAPALNLRILPWISLSVALSHGAFAITFLRLRERQRWAYRALITVMVLLTLSHVAIPQHLLVSLTLFGIGEALIAVIAVSAVATRLPGALWYAAGSAAFAVFAIGLFGVSCLGFNPWPAIYLMDYFRIGCLLEIICFCGAQVLRVLD